MIVLYQVVSTLHRLTLCTLVPRAGVGEYGSGVLVFWMDGPRALYLAPTTARVSHRRVSDHGVDIRIVCECVLYPRRIVCLCFVFVPCPCAYMCVRVCLLGVRVVSVGCFITEEGRKIPKYTGG